MNDPTQRPTAEALLFRATAIMQETNDWFVKIGLNRRLIYEQNIEDRVKSAVVVVAFDITISAMKKQGRRLAIPGFQVPRDTPAIIAFNIFVVSGICAPLEHEGFNFDFLELAARVAPTLLCMHEEEVVLQNQRLGLTVFREIASQYTQNVVSWHDNLMKLCSLYLDQAKQSANQKLKEADLGTLFSKLLGTLLNAIE